MISRNLYLYNPWEKQLVERAKGIEGSLDLICPFIKLSTIKKILAALPENEKLEIRILTRFTKQVFIQGSSDLTVFDLMLNYASRKYKVSIHNLDNLHAKIFIFDGTDMFITSSNLSYSGLNTNLEIAVRIDNPDDVKEVYSYLIPQFSSENVINSDVVAAMALSLKTRAQQLIKSGRITELDLEPTDTPVITTEESVLSENEEPEEEPIDLVNTKQKMKTLDEINSFLKERGVTEYQQIEDELFESQNRPMINKGAISPEDLQEFESNWNDKALKDRSMLDEYLEKLFGEIFSNDLYKLKNLKQVFVHNSWKNVYDPDLLNDYTTQFFYELGEDLHTCLIAKKLIEKRLFSEEDMHRYSVNLHYIIHNYPYGSVLSYIGCHFILHMGNLGQNIDREIFNSLMGCFAVSLDFNKLCMLYKHSLSRIEDFIFDDYTSFDYKTYLQEITQKELGLPKYEVVSASGPEHERLYEVIVRIGKEDLEKGFGRSKKEAEVDAAYNSLIKLSHKKDLESAEKKGAWQHLKKYSISSDRIAKLSSFLGRMPIQINNLRLLDVALTHASFVNENREKRSNRKLAFYGSYLDRFIRRMSFYEQLNTTITEIDMKSVHNLLRLPPNTRFPQWFDKMKLEDMLNRFQPLNKIPDSVKVETVQSLIATVFIDQGISATKEFLGLLWTDALETGVIRDIESPIARLQEVIQGIFKRSASELIDYRVIRTSKITPTEMEYEISCNIDGKEYGRGIGYNQRSAREQAAFGALNNQEFIEKYLRQD